MYFGNKTSDVSLCVSTLFDSVQVSLQIVIVSQSPKKISKYLSPDFITTPPSSTLSPFIISLQFTHTHTNKHSLFFSPKHTHWLFFPLLAFIFYLSVYISPLFSSWVLLVLHWNIKKNTHSECVISPWILHQQQSEWKKKKKGHMFWLWMIAWLIVKSWKSFLPTLHVKVLYCICCHFVYNILSFFI